MAGKYEKKQQTNRHRRFVQIFFLCTCLLLGLFYLFFVHPQSDVPSKVEIVESTISTENLDVLEIMMKMNYDMTLQDVCELLGDNYTTNGESSVTGSKNKNKSYHYFNHQLLKYSSEVTVSLSCLKDQEFEKDGKMRYITWTLSTPSTDLETYFDIKEYIISELGKPVEESETGRGEIYSFWGDIKLSFSPPLLTENNSVSLSKNHAWEDLHANTIASDSTGSHDWTDATCTSPKKCKKCGMTEGEALGHTDAIGYCERCEYQVTIYGLYEPQDVNAYYAVKNVVNQFKNPVSVKVIAVHHYDEEDDDFYMTISAENSYGGTTKESYFISGNHILEAGTYSDRIDREYNVGDINDLLQQYYKSEGWK